MIDDATKLTIQLDAARGDPLLSRSARHNARRIIADAMYQHPVTYPCPPDHVVSIVHAMMVMLQDKDCASEMLEKLDRAADGIWDSYHAPQE